MSRFSTLTPKQINQKYFAY